MPRKMNTHTSIGTMDGKMNREKITARINPMETNTKILFMNANMGTP
jgi:hypothetical protein